MNSQALKLAVTALALSDDVRQTPRMTRTMGFAGIQFDAFGRGLDIPALSLSGRRDFQKMLSTQDRQLAGLRMDGGPKGLGIGADIDLLLSRAEKAMEAAAGLGSPLLCLEVGLLPEPQRVAPSQPPVSKAQAGLILLPETAPAPVEPPTPPPDPALVSQVDDALREIGRRADRYNVIVALRSDLSSFAALERAIRAADCPWIGLDFDPSLALRDDWALDKIFSRLGSWIRHVRARDAIAGSDRRTRPTVVGQGSVDWATVLGNLDSADYRGWVTVDPTDLVNRSAAAAEARKFLESL